MKHFHPSVALFFANLLLTGCGQPGPLYLPGTQPPIHVAPEPVDDKKATSEQNALDKSSASKASPTIKPELSDK